MKKIGLLGGTFDPPHLGHMIIGEEAYDACGLDEVWFMPVNQPPHKNRHISLGRHRYNMVNLAIASNPHFKMCDIESKRDGLSYTIDTIRELRTHYPEVQFYFILGGDMVLDLPNWRDIKELSEMVTFIAFERPGFTWPDFEGDLRIKKVQSPGIQMSSTDLRLRIRDGRTTTYYLQEDVKNYIKEHLLYEG